MKAVVYLLVVVLCPTGQAGEKTEVLSTFNTIKVGDKAPSFGAPDVIHGNATVGLKRILEDDKVRGVVLSVFGSYCKACKKGIAMLEKSSEVLEKIGIKILLINYLEDSTEVERYAKQNAITLITLTDKFGANLKGYGLTPDEKSTLPKTFLIDKNQKIVGIIGFEGEDFIEVIKSTFEAKKK